MANAKISLIELYDIEIEAKRALYFRPAGPDGQPGAPGNDGQSGGPGPVRNEQEREYVHSGQF